MMQLPLSKELTQSEIRSKQHTVQFHFISMLNYSIFGFVTRVLLSISRVVKPFLQLERCQFKILQQQSVVWFWNQVSINLFQVYFYSNLWLLWDSFTAHVAKNILHFQQHETFFLELFITAKSWTFVRTKRNNVLWLH